MKLVRARATWASLQILFNNKSERLTQKVHLTVCAGGGRIILHQGGWYLGNPKEGRERCHTESCRKVPPSVKQPKNTQDTEDEWNIHEVQEFIESRAN